MQRVTLYRYTREDGGTTVSLNKPDSDYTESTRLIADENYILTDGMEFTPCVDTDNPEVWIEVEDPGEPELVPDPSPEDPFYN